MNQTPDAEHATLNVESSAGATASNAKHRTSQILWRILDFIIAGIFIFAGLAKILDLDRLLADLQHLRFGDALVDFRQLSFANPVEFASSIDNYRILPWTIAVALAFYLPWLEIFCGVALIFRRLYRGALAILTALVAVFLIATIAAKVRGLDITCGCFGHASQNWSFPAHFALDLAILMALAALCYGSVARAHANA